MAEKAAGNKALRSTQTEAIRVLVGIVLILVIAAVVLTAIAPRGSQLSRCEGVIISGNKVQCLYNLALLEGNSSICGSLSGQYSGSCYVAIAEKYYNSSLCYGINDSGATAACVGYIANATGSYKGCYGLGGTYRDSCISAIAMAQYNESLCAQIANPTNRTICSSSVEYGNALRQMNQSACANVTTSFNANATSSIVENSGVYNYSRAYENITSYMTLMAFTGTSPLSARDFCYLSYATQFANQSACTGIANQSIQDACSADIELSTTPISANSLNYTELINECTNSSINSSDQAACTSIITMAEAVNTRNVSLCASFNQSLSYQCYVSLATQYVNTTYCSYIKNYTVSSACVNDVVYNVTNSSSAGAPSYVTP